MPTPSSATMIDPHSIFNKIQVSGNLPSMPQVLARLIDSCHEPEINLRAIAQIIDKDAAISGKLLQLVNSAFIGARKAFTDVEQAVVYLGVDTVKNLTISVSIQQVFRRVETNGLLSLDKFWYHSCLNALFARNIALAVGYPDPSEAYLAGLLHDIGKLLMWMAFPGKYAPLLLKGIRTYDGQLAVIEEEKLQINHCEAGAWLCNQWQLPTLLTDAIRYHHHPPEEVAQTLPLARIVHLADILSHNEATGQNCLDTAALFFRLTPQQVSALYDGLHEQLEEIATQLGIALPAAAAAQTGRDSQSELKKAHGEITLGLVNRVRDIAQLNGVLEYLLRAERSEQIVEAVEQGVKILFNLESCLVLLQERDPDEYRCHVSPANKLVRESEGLVLSLARCGESLAGQAVCRRRLVHSLQEQPDSAPVAKSLIDTQLQRLLGAESLAVIPMVHRDTVPGLILIGLGERMHRIVAEQAMSVQLLANHAAVALILERTKAAQAEQLAAERVRSASLIAKKIAHEINNPLAALRNYLHVLASKTQKGEEIGEELAIIDSELERIGQITLNLEDLAREREELRFEQVNLQRQLEDILRLFRASLPLNNLVTLTFHPWREQLTVRTDAGCLRQILLNLLGNALDAVGGQGDIVVRTTVQASEVIISVEDNGPGIDPAIAGELFQAGASTKKGRHSGLGLAIAQKLAGQLGGEVIHQPGQGITVFLLKLPA